MMIRKFFGFILNDPLRFFGEIAMAVLIWLMTWGLSRVSKNVDLRNCQDERTLLLKTNSDNQRLTDSLYYSGRLAEVQAIIKKKDEDILTIREKMARDSVRHKSELESIRAINEYIGQHGGGGAVPKKR